LPCTSKVCGTQDPVRECGNAINNCL
jgi:hypothetical protein